VLLDELSVLYRAFVRGKPIHCRVKRAISGLRGVAAELMQGEVLRQQASTGKLLWWGSHAAGVAYGPSAAGVQEYAGALHDVMLDEELTAKLKELSKQHGATLYMTLLRDGWR